MREYPSRMSAQATRKRLPTAHPVASVSTRNLALGNSAQVPVLGSGGEVRPDTPVTTAFGEVNVSPPSVDRVYMIVDEPGECQTTWTTPAAATETSGANTPLVPGTSAPALRLPAPTQLVPPSLLRARRRAPPTPHATYARPLKGELPPRSQS